MRQVLNSKLQRHLKSFVHSLRALPLVLFIVLAPALLRAWPPTYGAEFEFTVANMMTILADGKPWNLGKPPAESRERDGQLLLVKRMRKMCENAGCEVKEVKGKWDKDYRVEYADGFWFKISYDPQCVEVTFKPSTRAELESLKDRINNDLFGTAKNMGFQVKRKNNHFNIGVTSMFDRDAELFLRFFVDYANHPDLANGSLGMQDKGNAPTLSVLKPGQRQALNEIISDFYAGRLKTIQQLTYAIETRIYTESHNKEWGGAWHYQAFGLKYINRGDLSLGDLPMELRSMWAQASAEQFIKIAELIEGRVNYLRDLKTPVIYTATTKHEFTPRELTSRFFIYVEEARMKYSDFEMLLPETVKKDGFDGFVDSTRLYSKQVAVTEGYWELIPTSSWVRNRIVEILSHAEAAALPEAVKLLERLELEVEASKPVYTRWQKFTGFFSKTALPADPVFKMKQEMLAEISKRIAKRPPVKIESKRSETDSRATIGRCRKLYSQR